MMLLFDSQSDGNNLIRLDDKVIFLWMHDNHYDCILDISKFLYFSSINFCVKRMKKLDSKFTHICLLPNQCIKCYYFHEVEKNLNNFSKCPCCDVIFYKTLF